jgi:DnaJ family protein C protein 28
MDFPFEKFAERKIQEAMEEGRFENLPGKGQPLRLDEDPFVPPHMRLPNKILKDAGVRPEWIELSLEIERGREECEHAWARMTREYPRRRVLWERAIAAGADPEKPSRDFAAWVARMRTTYLQAMARVNTDILKLNLLAPSIPRVHIPYRIAEQMARFDAAFPSPQDVELPAVQSPSPKVSEIRLAASALYQYGQLKVRDR